MEKMEEERQEMGRITVIKAPELIKEGESKKGKGWKLYSVGIQIDNKNWHNKTAFSKIELEKFMGNIAINNYVQIVDAKNEKGYWEMKSIESKPETIPESKPETIPEASKPTQQILNTFVDYLKVEEPETETDSIIDRYGLAYAKCKAKIEKIYSVQAITEQHIAAVNTLFIQIARDLSGRRY